MSQCHCSSLVIALPEYPYDELTVVLLPSEYGEVYRTRAIGTSLGRPTWGRPS